MSDPGRRTPPEHARDSAFKRDSAFMRRALVLARRGWGQTAPNPLVGAVVVRDGAIVGEGYHARYGEAHAEVAALRAAGDRARGATVYVTLEPCNHIGKTPPCADALIAAGVARVVAATRDPNLVAAGGLEKLAAAGIATTVGIEEQAARELDAPFFFAMTSDRPWVTLKLATSIDGAIADAAGRSRWITGDRARREVHRLRAGHDAIAIGIGTALADDPSLTVRGASLPRVPPRRVVFDRGARLPLSSTLVRTAANAPVTVIAHDAPAARVAALEQAGITVMDALSLRDALVALRGAGVRSMLVEGGARIAGALLNHALVDRLVIFRAPLVLGRGSLNAFAHVAGGDLDVATRFQVLRSVRAGDDVMTVYAARA